MQKGQLIEKTLMLGKIVGKRRKGQQRMTWLDGIIDSMHMNLSKPQETGDDRGVGHAACSPWSHRVRQALATEREQTTVPTTSYCDQAG